MNAVLAFGDTETTGLDPTKHEVWEVALVRRDVASGNEVKVLYQVRPNLETASPEALEIGGYHERFAVPMGHDACRIDPQTSDLQPLPLATVQRRLHRLLFSSVLIANNVTFDADFLRKLLGGAQPWNYRPVDVITMAATQLGLTKGADLPWRSEDVSRRLGVEPPGKDKRHTALGDAIWVRDLFDALK